MKYLLLMLVINATSFANDFIVRNKFPTAKGIDPNARMEVTYVLTPLFECDLELEQYSRLIVFQNDRRLTPYLKRRSSFMRKRYVIPTNGYFEDFGAHNSYYSDGLNWYMSLEGTFTTPTGNLTVDVYRNSRSSGDTRFHGSLGGSRLLNCKIHKPFDPHQVIIN
jgi:hypothetical protein